MPSGRFFGRLFLGNAALVVVLVAIGLAALTLELDHFLTPQIDPYLRIIGGALLVIAAAVAVGFAVTAGGRIRRLTQTAQAVARGDLKARADERGSDEIALLARSLSRLRDRLARQVDELQRQRRGLALLLDHLHEGVVLARRDGKVALINPAAAAMLGVDRATIEGISRGRLPAVEACVSQHELQSLLMPEPPTVCPAAPPSAGTSSDARVVDSTAIRIELQPAGGPISVLAWAADVVLPQAPDMSEFGAGGEDPWPARLMVLTDVTDLTRALKVRSDFVANASHELRTPLSAIRGAVETLSAMDPAEDTEFSRRFLDTIARQCRRLEALVADLLELSRLEAPGKRFALAPINVHRACDELRERWAEAIAAKNLQWIADIAVDCHNLHANAHLLQLALDNVVDNAVKFTPPGGRVQVRGQCRADVVAIAISDSGCGIPAADRERVFERFYQVDSARTAGSAGAESRGTGLGLSIVRHAVTAMGGTVELDSEIGKGTCVTLSLPRPASHSHHPSTNP